MAKKRYRKAVFLVVYALEEEKPLYLLLHRKLHWSGWELPKGGIEKGETELKAVKRELKEETHLKPLKIINFHKKGKYLYDAKTKKDRIEFIGQTWSLYAVKTKKRKIIYDKKEHKGFAWLDYKKAINILTWLNQKECLKIIDKRIPEL